MALSAKSSGSQDLIGRISNTIADHPRLSAAAAFQMGVLLGQVMQNSSALMGIGRKVASAPEAIASSIPTFGLFDGSSGSKPGRRRTRTAPRRRATRKSGRRKRSTQG